jgi:predicted transcriptional regulator
MTTEQNIDRAVTIVSAFVSANAIPRADLPGLITEVYGALQSLTARVVEEAPAAPLTPAVPVRKSIHPDFIICLEDGKKFKSLKRHLRGLGMTPEEYRAKWGLPADYPMVAPSYSATRSKLAKDNGLGRKADWQAAA